MGRREGPLRQLGDPLPVAHCDTPPGPGERLCAALFCCSDITPAAHSSLLLLRCLGFAFGGGKEERVSGHLEVSSQSVQMNGGRVVRYLQYSC